MDISDDTYTIMNYIGVWGWQLLAIISLFFSFLFFVLPNNLMSNAFYIALFMIFVVCEFMSLKRKGELTTIKTLEEIAEYEKQ